MTIHTDTIQPRRFAMLISLWEPSFTLSDLRGAGLEVPYQRALLAKLAARGSDEHTLITIGDVLLACGHEAAIWSLRMATDPRIRVAAIVPALLRIKAKADSGALHESIDAAVAFSTGIMPAIPEVVDRRVSSQHQLCALVACDLVRSTAAGNSAAATNAMRRATRAHPFDTRREIRQQESDLLAAFPPTTMRRPWWWRFR